MIVPATASAQTLRPEDYQRELQRAISSLYDLYEIDETEYPESYQDQFNETIATVHEALPEKQSVQSSDEVCEVDNSWLHADLEEFKKLTPEKRVTRLEQIIARLQALDQRVVYQRRAPTENDNKVFTKGKLESILSRPEYVTQERGPNALTRLLQDFIRWISQFLPGPVKMSPGRSSWMTVVAQVLVLIVVLAVVFYVIRILFRRFGRKRRKRAPKKRKARIVLGEQLKPEDTSTDLLSEAEALARRGELRAAIRKAYIALLVELGDRKVITLAQHKTNRDYLNSVRNLSVLHSNMRGLTDSFERHWYGLDEATDNDWQNFRLRYAAALQNQN
ncbi:MAG TPA: DUF4129 domain-containing protein [Pyrinomonadaceae bacterium]|nr:DUF4129 domain-containing protein [Pyrinomonadaceae bacterium]